MSQGDSSADSEYVLLVSSDGYEYSILRKAAMVSGTLQRMFEGAGLESQSKRVDLKDIKYDSLKYSIRVIC